MLDNYDSFTYNLFHYLESLGCAVDVVRANDFEKESIGLYDAFVLSPGPGLPNESQGMQNLISNVIGIKPILGVCLGMQAVGLELGGELFNQEMVKHGVQEIIMHNKGKLFDGMDSIIKVGLYHSWALKEGLGDYEITAKSSNGIVMALENAKMKVYGVQFHPESILTPDGKKILQNFLNRI